MLGCYANARPHDPATYTAAIAAVLSGYPEEVVMAITDPRQPGCIQRRSKWLPEVAEVAAACDEALTAIRANAYRVWRQAKDEAEAAAEVERKAELAKTRPVVMAKIQAWRDEVGPVSRKPWDLGNKPGGLIPHIVGSEADEGQAA